MMEPSVTSQAYAVPRTEADASEDAAALRADAWPLRVAVADGATESVFAGQWAELLAERLVEREITSGALSRGLPDWQEQWATAVTPQKDRPWYVEAKAREGAFAALLGLELAADGRWRAVAVGDCGLFHLRDGALHRAWPTADPDAFTHRPALLASRPNASVPMPEETTGSWASGDAFLVATDAVAGWLLRTDPARALNWSDNTFRDAVQAARDEGVLRSDDATLVTVNLKSPDITRTSDGGT